MQSRCWHCKRKRRSVARLTLAAASLCQRDLPEAAPRLALLNKSDIEAARLQWFAAVLDSKRVVPDASQPVLSVDPLMRRNIDLLKRTAEGNLEVIGNIATSLSTDFFFWAVCTNA